MVFLRFSLEFVMQPATLSLELYYTVHSANIRVNYKKENKKYKTRSINRLNTDGLHLCQ